MTLYPILFTHMYVSWRCRLKNSVCTFPGLSSIIRCVAARKSCSSHSQGDLPPYTAALRAKRIHRHRLRGLAVIPRLSPQGPVFPVLRGPWPPFILTFFSKFQFLCCFNRKCGFQGYGTVFDDEVPQEVEAPASESDNLSLVSETNMAEGGN